MAQIVINIPDDQEAAFAQAFLRAIPIPDLNEDGQPDYTARQWIKRCVVNYLRGIYRRGQIDEYQSNAPANDASTRLPDQ